MVNLSILCVQTYICSWNVWENKFFNYNVKFVLGINSPQPTCTWPFCIRISSCRDVTFRVEHYIAYTNSSPHNKPKEVNGATKLALKVVLEVNVQENSKHVVVATTEKLIDENNIRRIDRAPRKTFTGFIQEVANILNSYEDIAFADFFVILDEEIRKYHYGGCKFYELTENNDFRSLMAEKLDLIKTKTVPVLKADINEVVTLLRNETYDKNVKELLEYVNSLYREDVREKFQKFISDLKAYGNSTSERPKNDLVKIIRDGVRAIVFNHYTDLNINVRRELKKEITIFLKKIKEMASSSSTNNLFPYKTAVRNSENIAEVSGYNIAIEDKNPELSLKIKINPRSTAVNNTFILSDEKHREEATKLEISKEEGNSQQLQITYFSTDESSDETVEGNSIEISQERQRKINSQPYANLHTKDISYKNTDKPDIIYYSALRSELVQRILSEKSTGRLPTVQPTTAPKFMIDEGLRRSIPPPMPGEDLSIDVFDREERKRQKSIARRNRMTTVQHGIKDYIKKMRKLQNQINQLKKIDEYNQISRMNISSAGVIVKNSTDEYGAKDKNHKDKNKRKKSKKIRKKKRVVERERYNYETRAQTEKSKNKVRKIQEHVKKTNAVKEDEQYLVSNKETVKTNVRHANKLKKQKKGTRHKSTKATEATETTKTDKKYKDSTDADDAVTSVRIRVRRSLEPLTTAKNNVGNTTDNDNLKKLTNTTSNVTEEVKPNRINNTANADYVTKDNPTRRYRRVLEFSSPPHYDQPFYGYTFIA